MLVLVCVQAAILAGPTARADLADTTEGDVLVDPAAAAVLEYPASVFDEDALRVE